jgi:CelD/BcsL family acetyltransferase involved in cellulose biosynthesis
MDKLVWSLHPIERLERVKAEWETLAERLDYPPVLSATFAQALLTVFRPEKALIARLTNGAGVQGFAILVRETPWSWSSYQPDNAPLGLWLLDPTIAIRDALDRLIRTLPGLCLVLSLRALDPLLVRSQPGSHLRQLDYIVTAQITIDRPWTAWFDSRSKNLRHDLGRQRRRLAERGIEIEARRINLVADMPAAVEAYAALESTGWKKQVATAVTVGSPQAQFYTRLLGGLAPLGQSEIWQLLYNGEVAACDLCVRNGATIIILKTAYNEALAGNTSPAQLLHHEMFRWMFEHSGAKTIEFFGTIMSWHRRWTDESRALYHLTSYRWRVIQSLHRSLSRLKAGFSKRSNAAEDASQE